RRRQGRLALGAARAEAGAVTDDLDRDVADLEAGGPDASCGLAEQGGAGGPRPPGLGGAEVRAEVAEARGGQQRVGGGVRGDVGVGVPGEPALALPEQTGEPERAGRVLV